jgi:uncharacterized Fe-S center protein
MFTLHETGDECCIALTFLALAKAVYNQKDAVSIDVELCTFSALCANIGDAGELRHNWAKRINSVL